MTLLYISVFLMAFLVAFVLVVSVAVVAYVGIGLIYFAAVAARALTNSKSRKYEND